VLDLWVRERIKVCVGADESMSDSRRKELPARQDPRSDRSDSKTSMPEVEVKKESTGTKRPAEEAAESPVEAKKPCVVESALEDDLSEISDDADDILNRDEVRYETVGRFVRVVVFQEVNEPASEEAVVPEQAETSSIKDQQNSSASQKSQSPSRSPHRIPKDESIDEENMDLDFEEISEDELEEESRVKGIGDALGVDWASLVAESRPRTKPMSSAKRRWESHNVLINLGISVQLAGEDLVKDILREHAEAEAKEQDEEKDKEKEVEATNMNGMREDDREKVAVSISHPIGAIQVANREKQSVRKALFSNVGPNCRALSARRDLTIRRHLCNLPLKDAYVEAPKRHDPELLKLAVQMFERCL
jgi:hypothetical protein